MRFRIFKYLFISVLSVIVVVSCQQSSDGVLQPGDQQAINPAIESDRFTGMEPGQPGFGFEHAPVVTVDGKDYYFAGAPDGPDGATDIPGHYWRIITEDALQGKHFNTGPFGAPKWWSSDAPDGALLYRVQAIIDTWDKVKAENYASRGFLHYHELVSVEEGHLHPNKVVWLRHFAVRSFTLDGGPHPELAHEVEPGIDFEFIPNYMVPYDPESGH